MKKIIVLLIILLAVPAFGKHKYPEKYYQGIWCSKNKGRAEVVLADKTGCDCVTATHAIEHDFGKKMG